ncbi:cytochrome c3 family protein [Moritella sp. Urea-trap-13]|uniref:cytochrome c3 family protein n=1 Tax=Moritella sp. Urea-trap-13 TaxID=2058327 RepID=UPI000C32D25B|nr:cytochrome c3 family protein [Moritella sp. Urea-trap-13]PKH06115.1 deca-heme c-type cytochrome [Moritella sp. Urea-trap-13]
MSDFSALCCKLLLGFCVFYSTNIKAADFVGTKQCISCHQNQFSAWQGSDHEMSMNHATDEYVLGNFEDASFVFRGKENRFFKKGEQFWVNIAGPDGKFNDYQIKYTFAYHPLQQYMVEFDDGRVQLIPFAWDSRKQEEGGQRWFDLYPDQTETHQEFYWTNTGQNWNYMCSDCHSTNVAKNFNAKSNTYKTTFSDINVGCESCHGPGSNHITWTKQKSIKKAHAGFERELSKAVSHWRLEANKATLTAESINPSQQTLVCAQCHSRRVQISEKDHVKGNNFGERYLLSRINNPLYYPDGQIYDETFVYGSFLQSKMERNGVVCSNCHDPHSTKLIMPKEQLCLQCHQSDTYAQKTHHQHLDNSAGAQCVNCHMPETTYMQVDERADHGWHIPRPDIAKQLGTPDTCLSCHEDKNSEWSSKKVEQWFPQSSTRAERHFSRVFSAADQGYANVASALSHIAQNEANSNIIRASALDRLAPFPDNNTIIAVARGAKHSDSNIRLGAISGSAALNGAERWRVIAPLLKDEVLAVRAQAALAIVPLWFELSEDNKNYLTPALNEYMQIQDFNADRGYAHNNQGNVFVYQANYQAAEKAYKTGMKIEPYFANSYTNLAELYRRQQQNNQSIEVLKAGQKASPENASIDYQLGLAYIRAKQTSLAVDNLKQAAIKAPNNAQYHYVYALSIESINSNEAQQSLNKAYQVGGNPQHLYALCELQIRLNSFQANQCINELSQVVPENVVQQLKSTLQQRQSVIQN